MYSISAEKTLLATLSSAPHWLDEVATLVQPSDFFMEEHQKIFNAMITLHGKSMGLDLINLSVQLGYDENNPALLCLREKTDERNIESHAKIIRDFSIKRSAIQSSDRIRSYVSSNEGVEATDILTFANNEFTQLNNRMVGGGKTRRSYRDMVPNYLKGLKERSLSDGSITGLSTGFRDLDKLTSGLQPADLIIVAGRPSMGKTTFAMNIVENVCLAGGRAMVFSLEMPAEKLLNRTYASVGQINQQRLKEGKLTQLEESKLVTATEKILEFDLEVDDASGITIQDMRARAMKAHREKKLDLIMVDYLQLIKSDPANANNRNLAITEISNGLKQIAKDLGVPMVALSQLNRSLEQRPNKRPINSDLRDSGSIEQDADVIMFVYRDEVYYDDSPDKGLGEIIIGKQRDGELGMVPLRFEGQYSSFRNREPMAPTVPKRPDPTPEKALEDRDAGFMQPEQDFDQDFESTPL